MTESKSGNVKDCVLLKERFVLVLWSSFGGERICEVGSFLRTFLFCSRCSRSEGEACVLGVVLIPLFCLLLVDMVFSSYDNAVAG